MQANEILSQEFFLKPGYLVAHNEEVVVRCVLGSCLAVVLYDASNCVGGVNHFVWPCCESPRRGTVLYGNVAIPALLRLIQQVGGSAGSIEAQLFGGATPPHPSAREKKSLGTENVNMARRLLDRLGVPVVSEDVGGRKGRKLVYNTKTNEAVVLKVDRLRATDWYEHGQDVGWERT